MKKDEDEYRLCKSIITDGEAVRSIGLVSTEARAASSSEGKSHARAASELISGTEGGVISCTNLSTFDSSILLESTKHGHHVTAVIGIPSESGEMCGIEASLTGGYVSGCKDAMIRVFDRGHKLVRTLEGHEKAVTSLSWVTAAAGTLLLSGSWDGSAKLWNVSSGSCLATMDGHENTVSVQGLPPSADSDGNADAVGRFATGSAGVASGNAIRDHQIRLWQAAFSSAGGALAVSVSMTKTVANDHDGPIRGLAFDAATAMILSCSNDGSVRVRDSSSGEAVLTLRTAPPSEQQAQPPMLLDVTSVGAGKVAACSEDGNAFVWDISGGEHATDAPQLIPHPDCVWKIDSLPNADLVTACHDGSIRIFTVDAQRYAPAHEIAALDDAVVQARAKSSSGPSREEIANLPAWEECARHVGKSDGQVQLFRKGGRAIAAQWSAASQTWIEVGEVTGRNDSAGTIDGVRYDHVFPIEIDVAGGGVQKLQIGYNNGQNPFTTAQAFIDQHMLDQNYLSQIADYIRQRTGEGSVPTLGQTSTNAGNAAIPSPMDIDTTPNSYQELPMLGYKIFDTGADVKTLTKIMHKIRQFNADIPDDTNTPLSSHEMELLDKLCTTLGNTSRYHASSLSDKELDVISKMVTKWSSANCFPALDLARLAVLHPDASQSRRTTYWGNLIKQTLQKCHALNDSEGGGTTPPIAIPMLSLRLFANCFRGGKGSLDAVVSQLSDVLNCTATLSLATNKNVRLAVSTVLLNVASYLKQSPGSYTSLYGDVILSTVRKIFDSGIYETEATVRVLVALGTVLLADDTFREKAKKGNVASMVVERTSQHGTKASVVAKEIQMILQ